MYSFSQRNSTLSWLHMNLKPHINIIYFLWGISSLYRISFTIHCTWGLYLKASIVYHGGLMPWLGFLADLILFDPILSTRRLGARPTTFDTFLLMSEILAPGMKSTLAIPRPTLMMCGSMFLSIESPRLTFSNVVGSGTGFLFKCSLSLRGTWGYRTDDPDMSSAAGNKFIGVFFGVKLVALAVGVGEFINTIRYEVSDTTIKYLN